MRISTACNATDASVLFAVGLLTSNRQNNIEKKKSKQKLAHEFSPTVFGCVKLNWLMTFLHFRTVMWHLKPFLFVFWGFLFCCLVSGELFLIFFLFPSPVSVYGSRTQALLTPSYYPCHRQEQKIHLKNICKLIIFRVSMGAENCMDELQVHTRQRNVLTLMCHRYLFFVLLSAF